jgi:hypothetical protein
MEIIATEPGTVAESELDAGTVVTLHPAPSVPRRDWCALHWPWATAQRPAGALHP